MSKEQPYIEEYIKAKKAGISTEWYYHDFESGKDVPESSIPALLRVARISEMLFSNSAPRDVWRQLEGALKEVEELL